MRLLDWIADKHYRHGQASHANAAFCGVQRATGYLYDLLAAEEDPAERAQILRAMAGACWISGRAGLWLAPADRQGPSDLDAGRLLYLLADVEDYVATGKELRVALSGFGPAGWAISECAFLMAETPDLRKRHALLADFYAAVLPIVGSQAAEVVACIPAPDCPELPPWWRLPELEASA